MRMTILLTLGVLLVVQTLSAQGLNPLVGTWERFSITNDQGAATQQNPAFVIFSANGTPDSRHRLRPAARSTSLRRAREMDRPVDVHTAGVGEPLAPDGSNDCSKRPAAAAIG